MLLSPANDTHKEECFNRNRHPDFTYLHLALCSLGCFCWFGFKLYHVWTVEQLGLVLEEERGWAESEQQSHWIQDPKSFP